MDDALPGAQTMPLAAAEARRSVDSEPDFLGAAGRGRFRVSRRIGAGGMGVVYEAFDVVRGEAVALKTLLGMEPEGLYRFKREFRAVADITHPNLVALHELFASGSNIFFSMELVDGVELNAAVAHDDGESRSLDVRALRRAMFQLVAAVSALHRAGRLHRDIKSNNILVTPKGRLVLLDFGLVGDLQPEAQRATMTGAVLGTPAYMAPEQAANGTMSEATDWYAVGVVLFEALTGRLPFEGTGIAMLMAKQDQEAPDPAVDVPDAPADLVRLCRSLLLRDPAQRPGGDVLLAALARHDTGGESSRRTPRIDQHAFVGREPELGRLRRAFAAARGGDESDERDSDRAGHCTVFHVVGPSGMGKSALVRQFLVAMREQHDAVVLDGRCYERESVPYKGVDSLVDALCRYLCSLSSADVRAALPADSAALAQMFPVLERVDALARLSERAPLRDPGEQRRRAFGAFRELLKNIADRQPLILHVDDLQWADEDSVELLSEILRAPRPARVVALLSYRAEQRDSPVLRELPTAGTRAEGVRVEALEVGPMAHHDAVRLAERLGVPATRVPAIVEEAHGHPYFIVELAREAPLAGDDGRISLAGLVRRRVDRLHQTPRTLLELVALCGGPVPQGAVLDTTINVGGPEAAPPAPQRALEHLRAEHLVRTQGTRQRDSVEPFHDRVRDVVVERLSPDARRSHHRALARTLEERGDVDAEMLAVHYREGGRWEEGGEQAAVAAADAMRALAFSRAARLYGVALDLLPAEHRERPDLEAALGDALTRMGRGVEGARHLLLAVEGYESRGEHDRIHDLRRRAAMQLMRGEAVDDGLAAYDQVLRDAALTMPRGVRAIPSLLRYRVLLRLRGLSFTERGPAPEALARRIDALEAGARAMVGIDILAALALQARQTWMALRAGDPTRVATALAMRAIFASMGGASGGFHRRVVTTARVLAERAQNPDALGLVEVATGISSICHGEFRQAFESCERAEIIFRERCVGSPWELGVAQTFSLLSLVFLGRFAELRERYPAVIAESRRRDDSFARRALVGRINVAYLAADDVEGATRAWAEAEQAWAGGDYGVQQFWSLEARVQIDLYQGRYAEAWAEVERQWPEIERANLLRAQPVRIRAMHVRATAAVAAAQAATGELRERRLRDARAGEKRLRAEKLPWCTAIARLVSAGIAVMEGHPADAIADLEHGIAGCDAAGLMMWATTARHERGRLMGGAAGEAMVEEARAVMKAQRVREPLRIVAMLAPGIAPAPPRREPKPEV